MATILQLHGEPAAAKGVREALEGAGHSIVFTESVVEALQTMAVVAVELVVADDATPGLVPAELARLLQRQKQPIPLVVVSDDAPLRGGGGAAASGIHVVNRAAGVGCVAHAADLALEMAALRRDNESLRREVAILKEQRAASAPTLPPNAVVLTTLDVMSAEAALIARALEVCGGNRTRAAGLLGLSVRTLRNRLNGGGAASRQISQTTQT